MRASYCACWERCCLFQAYKSTDQGHTIELILVQLEWWVIRIVGYNQHMVCIGSRHDAFDERPLDGIEDISFVPLEEYVIKWHSLARNKVA